MLKNGLKYKLIAIDFDGTITDLAPHPIIGNIKPNAAKVIRRLKENGAEIAIWTCRGGEDKEKIINFLNHNNVPFDYFNEHFKKSIDMFGEPESPKIFADIYIDEKSLWAPKNIDWLDIEKRLYYDFKIGENVFNSGVVIKDTLKAENETLYVLSNGDIMNSGEIVLTFKR